LELPICIVGHVRRQRYCSHAQHPVLRSGILGATLRGASVGMPPQRR
jgi:hypothetical protein